MGSSHKPLSEKDPMFFEHLYAPKLWKEVQALRAEIREIDLILSGRSALQDFKTRGEKIAQACAIAARADRLEAEVKRLRLTTASAKTTFSPQTIVDTLFASEVKP